MSTLSQFSLSFRGRSFVPLIQGGMGVNISSAELALEIARLGGIGHISDAMSPHIHDLEFGSKLQNEKLQRFRSYQDKFPKPGLTWDTSIVREANRRYVAATMQKKRGDGAIFINIMEKLQMGAPDETIKARLFGALDGGIDGITLSAGLHIGTLPLIADHPRFNEVLIGIIVSSSRALKIFLRTAKRVGRLPDYIIVEGPLAGGHLGFGLDWPEHSLESITKDVMGLLRENSLDIPVVPAGGIFTGEDAARVLESGAAAIQVATRFTISKESGLPTNVKQKYAESHEQDVVVNLTSPTGYPMRMLKSSPSLSSNIKPNCEALGYILDKDGQCQYHDAYERAGLDEKGRKLPVTDKMCICFHFMKFGCYTCGHNVFRLKDTTYRLANGEFYLPNAEEVFNSYYDGTEIVVPELAPDLTLAAVA